MDSDTARADVAYIRDVMQRTRARIDPHAFHGVHWGAIVLLWYPLANWFCSRGRYDASAALTGGCFLLGTLMSTVRELRLRKRPRLASGSTFIGDQVGLIASFCVGAGLFLTLVGPLIGVVGDADLAIVWGFVYAVMAFMLGVVYAREYLFAGVAIFAGTIAAMLHPRYLGYILGPFMGLGLMIPGLMAERRVGRMANGHD
jgi:hypothetical protein